MGLMCQGPLKLDKEYDQENLGLERPYLNR